MITSQAAFQVASGLYVLALLVSLLPGGNGLRAMLLLVPALVCNTITVLLRYHQAWPMLPMHLGAVALPLCLGLILPFAITTKDAQLRRIQQNILFCLIVLLGATALCFPKDYYLPFLKSKNLFAHGFLWFGVVGKGCFFVSATWALSGLFLAILRGDKRQLATTRSRSLRWGALGFALWTISMFSGEFWSYLGCGTPVVWEDPALTLTMAAWFFYACFLHLHLAGAWNQTACALYASFGGLFILALTCVPDFGPFRAPF